MESLNMNVTQKSKPLNNDQNKIYNTQETININNIIPRIINYLQ